MKLLIIATTNFESYGITNVIMNYYRAMDVTDIQIDFVIPNTIQKELKNEIEKNGGRIHQIFMRKKNPLKYMKLLSQIISKEKYDIVHAHGNSCTLALEMYAAKMGRAKIRIAHSHNTTCKHLFMHRLLRKLFEASYTNGFACGKEAGEWLYRGKPFTVINNGVNLESFTFNNSIREEYREKYNLHGKKVVGNVGRFSYQKNHEFLINIFYELYNLDNNYRLFLVGDGELNEAIRKQVYDLGLNKVVIFIGKSPEVPQLLQCMDLVIMPSRFEGLPLTLVEAQAATLPCFVSTAITKEVQITDLIHFISLEETPKEWANQIKAKQDIHRYGLKQNIYHEIIDAGFSIKDNAEKLKKVYVNLLSNSVVAH